MKTLIGVGALLASSLLLASDAKAGIFDWFCRCPCPPPPCEPAATASTDGKTSYSSAYQPRGETVRRAAARPKTWEDYRRQIKGW